MKSSKVSPSSTSFRRACVAEAPAGEGVADVARHLTALAVDPILAKFDSKAMTESVKSVEE